MSARAPPGARHGPATARRSLGGPRPARGSLGAPLAPWGRLEAARRPRRSLGRAPAPPPLPDNLLGRG